MGPILSQYQRDLIKRDLPPDLDDAITTPRVKLERVPNRRLGRWERLCRWFAWVKGGRS